MRNPSRGGQHTKHDAVSAAAAMRPAILNARSETEAGRRLPDTIVDSLVNEGIFRMALPADLGGRGVSPVEMLEAIEELAKAEASVAWIVWNNALPCFFARFLHEDARKQIFSDPRSAYASSTRPTGKAIADGEGFRITGRWALVSGCMHANWVELMCVVERDGKMQFNEAGMPELLLACVPKGSFEIVDTWHSGGLRGTGSHDVVVDSVFVEPSMTFSPMGPSRIDEPIGQIPIISTMAAGHASICLGLCQSGIDAVLELAREKVTVDPVPDLRDKPLNQYAVAVADTKVSALRDHIRNLTSAIWAKVEAGEKASLEDVARLWSGANTTARECRELVNELYEVAGTSALYTDNPLERCLRDISAVMQHIIVQRLWVEDAGRSMFGLKPNHPLFAV